MESDYIVSEKSVFWLYLEAFYPVLLSLNYCPKDYLPDILFDMLKRGFCVRTIFTLIDWFFVFRIPYKLIDRNRMKFYFEAL